MTKRVITNIGDVFCAKINNYKIYLQYIANDLSQLNSDVIRVFKKKYPLEINPDLPEIINGDVDFYAHCVTSAGIRRGLWEKVDNIKNVGIIDDIMFKCKGDYTRSDIQNDWSIWRINQETLNVGELSDKYKNSYLGLIFRPEDILHKSKIGSYMGVFSEYE